MKRAIYLHTMRYIKHVEQRRSRASNLQYVQLHELHSCISLIAASADHRNVDSRTHCSQDLSPSPRLLRSAELDRRTRKDVDEWFRGSPLHHLLPAAASLALCADANRKTGRSRKRVVADVNGKQADHHAPPLL